MTPSLFEPLGPVAPRMMETLEEMPPTGLPAVHMDPEDPVPVLATSAMPDDVPGDRLERLPAAAGPGTACPLVDVELRHLRGALKRADPGASALSSRRTPSRAVQRIRERWDPDGVLRPNHPVGTA